MAGAGGAALGGAAADGGKDTGGRVCREKVIQIYIYITPSHGLTNVQHF